MGKSNPNLGLADRMTDAAGISVPSDLPWQVARRARIGVIIPSTNTGVEYDLTKFQLDGVSWHPSRLWIELRNWADESATTGESADNVFERFLDLIRDEIPLAVRNALSAKPTYMMMGMSAETFWGGLEGNVAFEKNIRDQIGDIGLTTGAEAVKSALTAFGAKTISVITPYPPVGDANVRRYFSDIGFNVKHVLGLNCASATAIAEIPQRDVAAAVRKVDGDDVDAIVQCGTNLSCSDLFPALEIFIDKPLLPINVACVWHALRACGIQERISGQGRLLEEF
jgi:maleate isomerase